MSGVERKHFYRFEYLKSEHWKDLRISKLASVDATCARCKTRDLSNDVHHVRYRNLYDVEMLDLIVLCRHCHDLVHQFLDDVRNEVFCENSGYHEWEEFVNLWGGQPNAIPELIKTIVEMRKAGKVKKPKDPCAPPRQSYYKEITLSVEIRDYQNFCTMAANARVPVEEWIFNLAKLHTSMSKSFIPHLS